MKKFRFPLEPVLEQRKRAEEEKQQVVAGRQREVDAAEAELRRLNDEFRTFSDRLRSEHHGLSGEELRMYSAHLQFLDRTIVAQIRVVAERRVALDRARHDLFEATKARKVVDKLKEKRREAYVAEVRRLEQAESDDANSRRFAHTGGNRL